METHPLEGTLVRLKNTWRDPPWNDYGFVFRMEQADTKALCVIARVDGGQTLALPDSVEPCPVEKRPEVAKAVRNMFEKRAREAQAALERLNLLLPPG